MAIRLIRVPGGVDLRSVRVRRALGLLFPEQFPGLGAEQPTGDTEDAERMRRFPRVERGELNP